MAKTFSAEVYLERLSKDPGLAMMPYEVAADLLQISDAMLRSWIREGQLAEIRIRTKAGSKVGVTLGSIIQRRGIVENRPQKLLPKAFRLIEDAARAGKPKVYVELMEALDLKHDISGDRRTFADVLSLVCTQSWEEQKILLGVIVTDETATARGRQKDLPNGHLQEHAIQLQVPHASEEEFDDFLEKHTRMVFDALQGKYREK
jgi:hypothetical protein